MTQPTKNKLKVLIVDDEAELRESLAAFLKNEMTEFEFDITTAEDGQQALELVEKNNFDLVLMDVRMPKLDGLSVLKKIHAENPRIFVVIMTAHSNLNDAVIAIKSGAYDYLEKPVAPEKLSNIIRKALETQQLVSDLSVVSPILDSDVDSDLVIKSQKMKRVFDLINKLSRSESPVMIRGESGTEKESVALAIHRNSSRKHGKFITIDCKHTDPKEMEKILFGHEKNAFGKNEDRKIGQLQLANNGTIFLNEISDLHLSIQGNLLSVLKDQSFIPTGSSRTVKTNARIIVATQNNLEKRMADGEFNVEFFQALSLLPIFMPPLRERIEDLERLVEFFIKKFKPIHNHKVTSISSEGLRTLSLYQWPRNIRELENVIEKAILIEAGEKISQSSIPEEIRDQVQRSIEHNESKYDNYEQFKEETEKEFIVSALKANDGRINKTVAHANIPKNTLLRKIKKYNIDVKQFWSPSEKDSK